MTKEKEFTTIQVYREDLKAITDDCKKDENLRDKLHEIVVKWKKGKNNE